jgi:hypothetical protein
VSSRETNRTTLARILPRLQASHRPARWRPGPGRQAGFWGEPESQGAKRYRAGAAQVKIVLPQLTEEAAGQPVYIAPDSSPLYCPGRRVAATLCRACSPQKLVSLDNPTLRNGTSATPAR